jgi:hypothetical protein
MPKNVHVSKNAGRSTWKMTQGGDTLSTHRTQSAAAAAGKREAKRDKVDLVTHGRDGRIRSKDSFGNDPHPPRERTLTTRRVGRGDQVPSAY